MRRSSRRENGCGRRSGRWAPLGGLLAAALAVVLTVGSLIGFVASEASATATSACTTTSTSTCAVTLDMTAGSFGVHGSTPESFSDAASITGTLDPTTGAITGATLSRLSYHLSPSKINTTSTETIIITQVTPGGATGSINYLGAVSYTAALNVLVTVHSPLSRQCSSAPVNVVLSSSTPYASGAVTIAQSNFTIPDFPNTTPPGPHCTGLVTNQLNIRYSGVVNEMSLSLTGALPLPPPPVKPTATTLTLTPPSPVLVGTDVTLKATVSATVGSTPEPTGHVTFKTGSTVVGTATLSYTTTSGKDTATLTSTTLPAKPTQSLTAVYSGDAKYGSSTSASKLYSVQPKPSVSTNLPATLVVGTTTPTYFTVRLTDPMRGESFTSLKLTIKFYGILNKHTKMTLTYENTAGTWCPVALRLSARGTFEGLTGACGSTTSFSLAAGQTLVVPFRITYASNANVGQQAVSVALQTLTGAGTVVAPFTATASTGIYANAPAAYSYIQVNPVTKYPLTLTTSPAALTIPSGYGFFPHVQFTTPSTTGVTFPTASGTYTYLVDGQPLTPPIVQSYGPGTAILNSLAVTAVPTTGLSLGAHTLTVVYSGSSVYDGAQITQAFTVTTAAPGTAYACTRNGVSIPGSVVASGVLPLTSNTGTARATLLDVTVNLDQGQSTGASQFKNVQITLSPGGTITAPTVTGSMANDTLTGNWSGLSATVPVAGSPGTVVPVGIASISFTTQGTNSWRCSAGSPAAVIGSVVVSGVSLAASPTSPVPSGTNVTLTATVAPATRAGQVNFFTTASSTPVILGTTTVPTSGPTAGVAKLIVQAPALGTHSYTAQWTGTVPLSLSNAVAYTVDATPVVTTQPTSQTVDVAQAATFTAAATGTPTPTVQWQLSTDGGSTWTTVTGATGTTYTTPLVTASDNANQYRAVFTNSAGSATTNVASLTVVVGPSVTTQPANQTTVTGSTATFTAAATGSVLGVQWQVSTNGGGSWSNAPGTPTNTFASRTTVSTSYTTPATTTADNANQYRAVFTNSAGTATSNAATLTVTTTTPPPPPAPPTPPAPPATNTGYRLVASNGSVYSYGTAPFYGSMGGQTLNQPIVGTASTPGDGGYWLVASDGGIFSFGNAAFYGSMGGKPLNQPIVGIAATPDGKGYWEVASDGGIFAFGDAAFYGSMGGKPLNKAIVGIAATPDGKGYWEVASDGGIFAFGDATFAGSTGSLTLNKPIVGMASTNTGGGYWLVASDGGVFSFGNAGFHGTVAGTTSAQIVSLVPTGDNGGYWETASNGQVFQFGNATSAGTALAQTATIVAMSD
jgi:hypothetical protein